MSTKTNPAAARATRPAVDESLLPGQVDILSIALPSVHGKTVSLRTIVAYVVSPDLVVVEARFGEVSD